MTTLGKQIRVLRVLRGMRQGEFAQVIGIRQATLSDFETGKTLPSEKTLERIKAALAWPAEDQAEAAFAILAGEA